MCFFSLDEGVNSFATPHPPSKTVPLPPLGKAFHYPLGKAKTKYSPKFEAHF